MADSAEPGTPDRLIAAARDAFKRLDGVLISVGGPPQVRRTPSTTTGGAPPSSRSSSARCGWPAPSRRSWAREVPSASSSPAPCTSRSPASRISNALRPGLAGYAKNLANELGPRGIRVVGLVPAHIETDRVRELDARGPAILPRLASALAPASPCAATEPRYRRSGLSTFIELETLRLGVEGKTLIWRTLLVVATGEPRLDESQLQDLLDRARGQINTLEKLRLAAAAAIFSPGPRRIGPLRPR